MKRNRKPLVFIIMASILAAGGYGYYMYNKPVSTLDNVTSDIIITSTDLGNAYASDEVGSDAKYLDKIISVNGVISKIENKDGISIYLKTDSDFSQVICKLDHRYSNINHQEGDRVIVKGLCTGYLMDVLLVNATIIN